MTYSAINPLPMRFPATNPPVKGDHIDIGVWPNGWQFMTQRDRIRFEQLSETERAQYRNAFELQATALADRQPTDIAEVIAYDEGRIVARHGFASRTDARSYADSLRRANDAVPGYRVEVIDL